MTTDQVLGKTLARDMFDDAKLMVLHVNDSATEIERLRGLLERWLTVAAFVGYTGTLRAETKKELGL